MISEISLKMIRCPETRQELALADPQIVADLNRQITAKQLQNRAGETLERTIDGGLIRSDRRVLYPILDGIPILLTDEGIWLQVE
jgi:uncharacterized protein YbaR (Trm112 family)